LIANVVNFRTGYLPELTPAKCHFAIFFTTYTLANNEPLTADNIAGIHVLPGDTAYYLSHGFRVETFAATNEHLVLFYFDDVKTSNDAYNMQEYLKSQLGRMIRVYITWRSITLRKGKKKAFPSGKARKVQRV